jgi:hypothetical protein
MTHLARADIRESGEAAPHPGPSGRPDRVYCSIVDSVARLNVSTLVERMHADPIVMQEPNRGLRIDGQMGDAVGLIYDLAPWTPDAVQTVQHIRAAWPHLSILLFPPPVDDVDDLVSNLRRVGGIRVRFQPRSPDDLQALENDVLWVLHSHSLHQMITLARGAIGTPPPRITQFVNRFMEILCSGRRAKVDEIAREFRVSSRTLERGFAAARFPTPKETADWLTLLYLAYTSDRYGVRLSRTARPLHIAPNHIYRLKRRLLPDFTWSARTRSGDLLSAIITRFARRVQSGRGF